MKTAQDIAVGHTPGPWEVVKHDHITGELWLSVNQCADAVGMKEWIAEIKYLTTDEARQWANARLIAAAPDLLAAVRLLDDVVDAACSRLRSELPADESTLRYKQGMLDIRTLQNRASTIARTAIAKADGTTR